MDKGEAGQQGGRAAEVANRERARSLVQIAYRHIAERGFEGLRVRDVAEEAGINNATLHYYFPSKEALIQGVVEYLLNEFQVNHSPQQEISTPLDALRAEFDDIVYRLTAMPEMFVVLYEFAARSRRDAGVAALLHHMEERWHTHMRGILERGVAEGTFRSDLDYDVAAAAILAQMKSLTHPMPDYPGAVPREKVMAQVFAQIADWLQPRSTI